jgi:hypothetical protein
MQQRDWSSLEWSFTLTYFLWPSLGIEALEATGADNTRQVNGVVLVIGTTLVSSGAFVFPDKANASVGREAKRRLSSAGWDSFFRRGPVGQRYTVLAGSCSTQGALAQ